ncbi:MAG: hypothetical protein M0R37_01040 [Bacteroidales bacterium]|nr:hypothetical protein [Bacteroidales bacterium]
MKHFLLAVFTALVLFSCKKDTPRDTSYSQVYGSWKKVEEKYLITPNQDCQFLDLYDSQWTGTLTINGNEIDFGYLRYFTTNTGDISLASDVISFTYYVLNIQIRFDNKFYLLTKPFTFDKASGHFIVNSAQAREVISGDQITVSLDLRAQTRMLQKNVEYEISPAGVSDMPYTNLTFSENGTLNGSLLWKGDIACTLKGEWYVKSNALVLKYKADFASIDGEKRELVLPEAKGDSLIFTRIDSSIEYDESSINIPKSAIEKLKFKTAFVKE